MGSFIICDIAAGSVGPSDVLGGVTELSEDAGITLALELDWALDNFDLSVAISEVDR